MVWNEFQYLILSLSVTRRTQNYNSWQKKVSSKSSKVGGLNTDVPIPVQPYWDSRIHLALSNRIIFKQLRIVVPPAMREPMLKLIHQLHMGIVKSKHQASTRGPLLARDECTHWRSGKKIVVYLQTFRTSCPENRWNRNPQSHNYWNIKSNVQQTQHTKLTTVNSTLRRIERLLQELQHCSCHIFTTYTTLKWCSRACGANRYESLAQGFEETPCTAGLKNHSPWVSRSLISLSVHGRKATKQASCVSSLRQQPVTHSRSNVF